MTSGPRAALCDEWAAALHDAGSLCLTASLWPCEGYTDEGPRDAARCYQPGWPICSDVALTTEQRSQVESETNLNGHRIVLFEDFPSSKDGAEAIALTGGLLRHELEHARQHEAVGPRLWEIDELLKGAMARHVNGVAGGGDLCAFRPVEQDANAAAAAYVRERHPGAIAAILNSQFAHVARPQTPPQCCETLFARTVACLYQFHEICEGSHPDAFTHKLIACDQRAADLWKALKNVTLPAPRPPS